MLAVVVKNRVTPKWGALLSGNMDQNLWSNSWWYLSQPKDMGHTQSQMARGMV